MKFSSTVSSSRRKARKAHFTSDSETRHKLMSSTLSKELRKEHGVKSLPVRKQDEVQIIRGHNKGSTGEVKAVYRKKFVIHVDRVVVDKANGQAVPKGIHPSNVEITKIKMDKDRKALIARKLKGKEDRAKRFPAVA